MKSKKNILFIFIQSIILCAIEIPVFWIGIYIIGGYTWAGKIMLLILAIGHILGFNAVLSLVFGSFDKDRPFLTRFLYSTLLNLVFLGLIWGYIIFQDNLEKRNRLYINTDPLLYEKIEGSENTYRLIK